MVTANDVEQARQTIKEGGVIHRELEHELIVAGGWEPDGVKKIVATHGDKITVDGGKVVGVKDAIAAHRATHPEAFCELGPIARNEKLPAMTRFAAGYRDIVKYRDRKKNMGAAQARGMRQTRQGAA